MFFEQLKKICREKGTSPSAAALAIGMSKSAVTRWRKGQEPSFGDVIKLAQFLSVEVSDLIDDDTRLKLQKEAIKKAPNLTKEDERDIARDLEAIVDKMATGGTLMFDGNPLTDESPRKYYSGYEARS